MAGLGSIEDIIEPPDGTEVCALSPGVPSKIIKGTDGFASHYAINIWRNINVILMFLPILMLH